MAGLLWVCSPKLAFDPEMLQSKGHLEDFGKMVILGPAGKSYANCYRETWGSLAGRLEGPTAYPREEEALRGSSDPLDIVRLLLRRTGPSV